MRVIPEDQSEFMARHGVIALVCVAAGCLLLGIGALVPAHLRAVDRDVLVLATRGTPSLVDVAAQQLAAEKLGPARAILESVPASKVPGVEAAMAYVPEMASRQPGLGRWGGPNPWLDRHVATYVRSSTAAAPAVLQWALTSEVRGAMLGPLSASTHPGVMAMMACRALTNTALFPAVGTASGQPLDAALLITAAMLEQERLHPSLGMELERLGTAARQGKGTLGLERGLLDLLAGARWLDWEQLTTLLRHTEDLASLQGLVLAAGADGARWNFLLAAVLASDSARGVAEYLKRHGDTGRADLTEALVLGTGAVKELVRTGHTLHRPKVRNWVASKLGLQPMIDWFIRMSVPVPRLSLVFKHLLWLDGLFLLVHGLWHARRLSLDPEVREFEAKPNLTAQVVVAVAGAILVFLAVEKFLEVKRPQGGSDAMPQPMFTARLRLDLPPVTPRTMNDKIVGMLVAFFVIQAAIYLVGLARLKNIRNQMVEAGVKLRLLDNEETMFDAPLYMGIAGSVLALVMRLTGFEGISLMASYSSTLFGILFCFILKVMHVRPYRQRLILESVGREAT